MTFQNFNMLLMLLCPAWTFALNKALNTAASGMAVQEQVVNTISHNIANLNTIGFKKMRAESDDLHYQTIVEQGARSNSQSSYTVGVQIGSGAVISATRKEFSQGDAKITNNPFDLMIQGKGFFGILLPNGNVRYTRDGAFNLDQNSKLVNKNGFSVFPEFTFPPGTTSVNISENGIIEAFLNNTTTPINVGQLSLFTFINPVGLKLTGKNLYDQTVASGPAQQGPAGTNNSGTILQGALEAANVNIMTEMTDLIRAQRAYEMNSKVMGVVDKMLQTVNNIR